MPFFFFFPSEGGVENKDKTLFNLILLLLLIFPRTQF